MTVVHSDDQRRTETPNAVMTTLASPTVGGAQRQALWRVEMRPDQSGPLHAFDVEQIWTVLAGSATVELDGEIVAVAAGESVVMPAGAVRRIAADRTDGLTALVAAPSGARATLPDGTDGSVPAWIA
jgi:quercetin dioxygenase-like cupin family protein